MNKLNYFNKVIISAMALALLVGCGKKVEPVQSSSPTENSAIEDKSTLKVNTEETKPAEITKKELKEIKMDADLQKRLNIFFSNFSEAYISPFEKDKIEDSGLIKFGVMHVIINNYKLIQYKGDSNNEGYIKAEDVDTKTYYYFRKKVEKHKTVEDYTFEKGYYKIQMASGEGYTFSQIDKLYDSGNNKYKAEISIYRASSGFTGDAHGTINDWKASGEQVPELVSKVTAIIEKINEDGKERYILIEYI
jgi:hypothetical protein